MMAMRLARMAGRLDVDGMMQAMPAGLFVRWCAYYRLEPWGFEAENQRHVDQAILHGAKNPQAFAYNSGIAEEKRPLSPGEVMLRAGVSRKDKRVGKPNRNRSRKV